MDAKCFDRLTVAVAHRATRRSALTLAAAAGLSALLVEEALAACADNGTRCGQDGDLPCCSGRCVRKRGTTKKFCRQAPGQGICKVQTTFCGGDTCGASPPTSICRCHVTSRGYSFCGGITLCFACETDTDCEKWSEGQRGDRCVECATCPTNNNRACARKCPDPD